MSTVIEARPPVREGGEIEAQVNYLAKGVARPVAYTFEPPPGTPWTTGELAPRRVKIRDARPRPAGGGGAAPRPARASPAIAHPVSIGRNSVLAGMRALARDCHSSTIRNEPW